MKNLDIRKKLKEKRIFHYEIASELGIGENTFCRWMRTEMDSQKKKEVLNAIEKLSGCKQ